MSLLIDYLYLKIRKPSISWYDLYVHITDSFNKHFRVPLQVQELRLVPNKLEVGYMNPYVPHLIQFDTTSSKGPRTPHFPQCPNVSIF